MQRAAETTGLLGRIAARAACQSTTVDSFLRLAGTLSAVSVDLPVARANKPMAPRASVDMEMFRQKLDASFDRIDPVVQRALRFEEDVPEAPCGTTDSNAGLLDPAASKFRRREAGDGSPIPLKSRCRGGRSPSRLAISAPATELLPDQYPCHSGARVATGGRYDEVYRWAIDSFPPLDSLIGETDGASV
ncbi:MAG: hypothetical protein U5O69_03695 [Candidatus Competibacteraceae bacterium]|nr:hypothetical protein [Candidatus Competibacteraceae bacterium]